MDDLKILGEIKEKTLEIEKCFNKDEFFRCSRPEIYSKFDKMYNVLNKKLLIDSIEDIEAWENDVQTKIVDSCINLDEFLQNVLKAKEYISSELYKTYYSGLIKEISYLDVQSYMKSEIWENIKMLDKQFEYDKYVPSNYSVYQPLLKLDNKKFILILIDSFDTEKQVMFKSKDISSKYYILDLSKEYLKS